MSLDTPRVFTFMNPSPFPWMNVLLQPLFNFHSERKLSVVYTFLVTCEGFGLGDGLHVFSTKDGRIANYCKRFGLRELEDY